MTLLAHIPASRFSSIVTNKALSVTTATVIVQQGCVFYTVTWLIIGY